MKQSTLSFIFCFITFPFFYSCLQAGGKEIKGNYTIAVFKVYGSGNINAWDYLTSKLECAVDGSGNITAYIYEKIKASVTGSGMVEYKGNPELLETNVHGSGNIKKTGR
jgi:hypothetical protein